MLGAKVTTTGGWTVQREGHNQAAPGVRFCATTTPADRRASATDGDESGGGRRHKMERQ